MPPFAVTCRRVGNRLDRVGEDRDVQTVSFITVCGFPRRAQTRAGDRQCRAGTGFSVPDHVAGPAGAERSRGSRGLLTRLANV